MIKIMAAALLLYTLTFTLYTPPAYAQGLNTTSSYEIADPEAIDGDILAFDNGLLKRTNIPFSNNIFGVLDKQAVVTVDTGSSNEQPITLSGTSLVNVTTIAGPIKKGDRISTSAIAGKGQKMNASGYSLGIALADYNGTPDQTGQIPVALKIEYSELTTPRSTLRLLDAVAGSLFQNARDPKNFGQLLRFFIAGLAVLAGFAISFVMFSRSVPKSIDAIGRNPLAQKSIYFVTWMNIFLAVIISLIGVGAAYLILKF